MISRSLVIMVIILFWTSLYNVSEHVHLMKLNQLIEYMELGHTETDRPAPIRSKTLTSKEICLNRKVMYGVLNYLTALVYTVLYLSLQLKVHVPSVPF